VSETRSSLEGVAALTKQLNELSSLEEGRALKRAARVGIKQTFLRSESLITVGTRAFRTYRGLLVAPGFAKASLRIISTINREKNIASGILGVRKEAYYAVSFLERGTRKMPAQPWIRRALSEARTQSEEAFRDSIKDAVEKAARKT